MSSQHIDEAAAELANITTEPIELPQPGVSLQDFVAHMMVIRPEQEVLLKHGMVALGLVSTGRDCEARCLLQFLCTQSETLKNDAAAQLARSCFEQICDWLGKFGTFGKKLMEQCDAQALSISDRGGATLRHKHLLVLKEVARALGPIGEAKLPRAITWSFLRNPEELVLISDSHMHAISLQNGREVYSQSVTVLPAARYVFMGVMQGESQSLPCVALRVGLRQGFQGAPHVNNLTIQGFQSAYYSVMNGKVKTTGAPQADLLSENVVLCDRQCNRKLLRLGCVAVSAKKGWFACWSARGTRTIMLGDLSSNACHTLEEQEETEPDEWEVFALAASGQYLFAANDCSLKVFDIKRTNDELSWNTYCHQFEDEFYHVHIGAISARGHAVAALVLPNASRPYSYINVFIVIPGKVLDMRLLQHVYGKAFGDVRLTEDLILTITSEYPFLVQAWPKTGPVRCLLQLSGTVQSMATLYVIPAGACRKIGSHLVLTLPPLDEADSKCPAAEEDIEEDENENENCIETEVETTLAESAETILPEEAAAVEQELWSSRIEHSISAGNWPAPDTQDDVNAMVLAFSRHTSKLEDALMSSSVAHSAIESGIDIKPALANGAKVFVAGVSRSLLEDLSSWHVVLHEKDEPTLHAALKSLPYNIRKQKLQSGFHLPEQLSLMSVSDDEICNDIRGDALPIIEYTVERTFIVMPKDQTLDTRSVRTV